MRTIRRESETLKRHPLDVDNFRAKYEEFDPDTGITVIFPSYEIQVYEHNLFRLKSTARIVPFQPRWERRPDYTSYDLYGTTIFAVAIMFVNDVDAIEDFVGFDNILAPNERLLSELVLEKFPSNYREKIESTRNSFKNLELFLPKKISAPEKIQKKQELEQISDKDSKKELVRKLEEKTEDFQLTEDDLSNMFVTLAEKPVNETSVTVFINDFSVPLRYGYDYVLKKVESGSDVKFLLSWNPEETYLKRSRLKILLKKEDKLTVKYLVLK